MNDFRERFLCVEMKTLPVNGNYRDSTIADACNLVYAQRGLALFRVDAVRDG